MRKIPTLFMRDPDDRRHVTREVNPDAAWVFTEPRVLPTRKFDGTCTKLDENGKWWARREVKPGKSAPANFAPEELDEITGKIVGWEPIDQSPFVKAWREVMENPRIDENDEGWKPGTYELCGPKVNGNPEKLQEHALIPHGSTVVSIVPSTYDELAQYMAEIDFEGVVWHHPDGRMAKLKRRDFA